MDACLLLTLLSALSLFPPQLPIKVGHQNTHTKVSTEHNKECLINISKYKFSLVISGLTTILKNVNNMVSPESQTRPVPPRNRGPPLVAAPLLTITAGLRKVRPASGDVISLSAPSGYLEKPRRRTSTSPSSSSWTPWRSAWLG